MKKVNTSERLIWGFQPSTSAMWTMLSIYLNSQTTYFRKGNVDQKAKSLAAMTIWSTFTRKFDKGNNLATNNIT